MVPSPARVADAWITASERWYHGRTVHSTSFDLRFVGRSDASDQEGPGFYFTTNLGDALGYAHPNGIVLSATLAVRKWLPLTGAPKRKEVERLMRASPCLDEMLTNWDEDPRRAFALGLDQMISAADSHRDALLNVWSDFYRRCGASPEWCRQVVKLGYDGVLIPRNGGQHAVVFDPGVIRDVRVEPPTGGTA